MDYRMFVKCSERAAIKRASLFLNERAMGIEPTAFSLARRRSTGELRPRKTKYNKNILQAQYLKLSYFATLNPPTPSPVISPALLSWMK